MEVFAVIMAGGTGTRLWPLSTEAKPKQTHRFFGEYTIFQESVQRIRPLIELDHILIVAGSHHVAELRRQTPNIPEANFIVEPSDMGTAPCIGLAAVQVARRNSESVMVVLTADHYIGDVEGFHVALETAIELALKGHLVTFGIKPSDPSTGYGYIEHGGLLDSIRGLSVLHVSQFIEKPDKKTALEMVKSGRYSWNSGMFIWRVDRIFEEFRLHMPELNNQLLVIGNAVGSPSYTEVLEACWRNVPRETIDYGIMEKASSVLVVPIDIDWSDLGTWSSLMVLLPKDSNGNVVKGKYHGIDTFNSLIYGGDRLITTIGVSDLIIVDTDEALLICEKSQDQKVRDLVKLLKFN
ncbi:mannose-1-phosphate guanylyltransferase [Thermoproteota archaeon]